MNEFKGQVKDTLLQNNPVSTWHHAKNIIKDNNKILNEDGFVKERDLPGVILGEIGSNDHTVYFSYISDSKQEIGFVDEATQVYTIIVRDQLHFNLNCLIEGVYVYNNKKEFIVIWSDGIKKASSSPFILNVHNPPIKVKPNYEFAFFSNIEHLKLFPKVIPPRIIIDYESTGDLKSYSVLITMKYITKDDSDLLYFPVSSIAYTSKDYNPTLKQGLKLKFSELSDFYDKMRIGLIINEEGSLKGYESDIIYYGNGDPTLYDISITSLSGFTPIAAEEILISSEIFTKVRTITKTNDELFLANTVKDELVEFQKYANNIVLEPIIKPTFNKHQESSFMPNEVYAFYIQLQRLDGSYYPYAFHIPNRPAGSILGLLENNKVNDLSSGQKTSLGLGDMSFNSDQKIFQYVNTGKVTGSTIEWGYWENEETYPNSEQYDSTDEGGEDLRNTPIRYHRFPNVNTLRKAGGINATSVPGYGGGSSFKLGVKVHNFIDDLPSILRDKIQGYRLCYVKRSFSDSLIIGDAFAIKEVKTSVDSPAPLPNTSAVTIESEQASLLEFRGGMHQPGNNRTYEDVGFTNMRLYSPELFKYMPSVDVTHIEAMYYFRPPTGSNTDPFAPLDIPTNYISGVDKTIRYAKENNMKAKNLWGETGVKISVKKEDWLKDLTVTAIMGGGTKNIALYVNLYQIKKNLYSGFTSNNLIIAGEASNFNGDKSFYFGDVFTKNEMNLSINLNYWEPLNSAFEHLLSKLTLNNLYQSINLAYVFNEDKNMNLTINQDNIPKLDNFTYEVRVQDKIGASSILDTNGIQTYKAHATYNNTYPFRINRSVKIPDENMNTKFLRTFLINSYYEMPNDKGEIIALRGTDYSLYIQQKYGLYLANAADSIKTDKGEAYLGNVDLFYRKPKEIIYDEDGYIGCQSQYACNIFKDMYITIDRVKGKIFLVGGEQAIEISKMGNEKFFKAFLNTSKDIDLPYTNIGLITGYDDVGERILLTKRDYVLIDANLVNESDEYPNFYIPLNDKDFIDFNNEEYFTNKSFTYSYGLADKAWICEHDYIPNMYIRNNKGIRSIINNLSTYKGKVYKHNIKNNKGVFYDKKYTSYVDLIFNQHSEIDKIYKSLEWMTEVIAENGGTISNETITHIMAYNNEQCTGLIDLKNYNLLNNRKVESTWKFNDLRDLVINKNLPIVDKMDGTIHYENIEFNKPFFEKRNFISNFIVVRLLIDNTTNNDVYINYININSIKSYR